MGVGNGYYQPFVGLGPSGSRATSSNRLFDQDADAEEQGSRSNGSAVLITLSEKEIDERVGGRAADASADVDTDADVVFVWMTHHTACVDLESSRESGRKRSIQATRSP